jgi:hypothetical protein
VKAPHSKFCHSRSVLTMLAMFYGRMKLTCASTYNHTVRNDLSRPRSANVSNSCCAHSNHKFIAVVKGGFCFDCLTEMLHQREEIKDTTALLLEDFSWVHLLGVNQNCYADSKNPWSTMFLRLRVRLIAQGRAV